jgi:probable HAF family extracellular repeat protein
LDYASAINALGQIVGGASDGNGARFGFLLTPLGKAAMAHSSPVMVETAPLLFLPALPAAIVQDLFPRHVAILRDIPRLPRHSRLAGDEQAGVVSMRAARERLASPARLP